MRMNLERYSIYHFINLSDIFHLLLITSNFGANAGNRLSLFILVRFIF